MSKKPKTGVGLVDTEPTEHVPTEQKPPRLISPLGRKLRRIRAEIIASGEPLLSWEEIDREVAERRGGYGEEDE